MHNQELVKEILLQIDMECKAIKGMRDVLSHHYFDINAEAIYCACQEEIEPLQKTFKQMIKEIKFICV